jgi:hypothetical protein
VVLRSRRQVAPRETLADIRPGQVAISRWHTCTACHGFKLVRAGAGAWAVGGHARLHDQAAQHAPLEGNDRKIVLDYLEATFPALRAPGGFQNPFLKSSSLLTWGHAARHRGCGEPVVPSVFDSRARALGFWPHGLCCRSVRANSSVTFGLARRHHQRRRSSAQATTLRSMISTRPGSASR